MTSKVVITLINPGFLVRGQGIEFVLDGIHKELMQFGDKKEFDIAAGEHEAQVLLHGVFNRSSKKMKFSLGEGQIVNIEARYSRLWGNMNIRLA